MNVNDEQATFNVLDAMRLHDEVEECSAIETVESVSVKEFYELIVVGAGAYLEAVENDTQVALDTTLIAI